MKLEMSTQMLPLIEPGTYGTSLGDIFYEVEDDYIDDFKAAICKYGKEAMNEILEEIEELVGKCSVENVTFHSPRFYNHGNDWLEFDLIVGDDIKERIMAGYKENSADFMEYAKERFGSHEGFISFFPYDKKNFEDAMEMRANEGCFLSFNRAVAMYIYYLVDNRDIRRQEDFEDSVIEEGNKNGWYIDYEED